MHTSSHFPPRFHLWLPLTAIQDTYIQADADLDRSRTTCYTQYHLVPESLQTGSQGSFPPIRPALLGVSLAEPLPPITFPEPELGCRGKSNDNPDDRGKPPG